MCCIIVCTQIRCIGDMLWGWHLVVVEGQLTVHELVLTKRQISIT